MPAKKYRLDGYRKAAAKAPFVLEVDDERENDIVIQAPKNKNVIRAAKLDAEDMEVQLQILLGDSYDALMDAIGDDNPDVLRAIVEDVRSHFGLDEGEAAG